MKYTNRPKVLALLTQENSINATKGMLHNCIAKDVKSPCAGAYIDWNNVSSDDLKKIETEVVGCANVKSVSIGHLNVIDFKTVDNVLEFPLCNSCVTDCDPTLEKLFAEESRAAKILKERILISKEADFVSRAFDVAKYDNTFIAAKPEDNDLVGGNVYDLSATYAGGISDPAAKIRDFFDGLAMGLDVSFNQASMTKKAYLHLRRRADFLKGGCNTDPLATKAMVAELLGVKEICIAESVFDNAASGLPQDLKGFVSDSILFTKSAHLNGPNDVKRTFAFNAVTDGWYTSKYQDHKMGAKVTDIIKIGRKDKLIIADYKQAALITNIYG